MFEPFEYFMLRNRDGLLKTDFKKPLGKIAYHIPCHSRVQNIGQKTREALQLVPGTTVKTVERCAGHDGTWGVKREYYAHSMKIGRPVFRAMAEETGLHQLTAPMAGRHIEQGMGDTRAERQHPLSLLRIAYGL
jgi:Fe-S oxidoreductase